jgi:hypothetical protein
MKYHDLPPKIASRPRGKELHVDASKKVTTLHAVINDTEDGLGFSPGALAQKLPTMMPPRELRHPQASSAAAPNAGLSPETTYPHTQCRIICYLRAWSSKHDMGDDETEAPPPPRSPDVRFSQT